MFYRVYAFDSWISSGVCIPAKRTSKEVALAKRKVSKLKDFSRKQHLNKLMDKKN